MTDSPDQQAIEEITDALAKGHKIEAIKIYRESTGKGLKEAKDFIDSLVPRLIEKDPEKYANIAVSAKSGCASALVLMIAFCALIFLTYG